jgi:Flp pilus assembly protein TadG
VDTRIQSRKGATTIQLLVVLVPVLFGLIGFAVDLGRIYMIRGELKTAANAMAMAAASKLIGTDQALTDATNAAKIPIDTSTGYGDKYDFGGLPIGQTTGQFTSSVSDPTFYSSLADATSGNNPGTGGSSVRYAQVSITADAPLVFWRFLPIVNTPGTPVAVQSVAGISAPLCTACSIEPFAVAAVDATDATDFGFVQGTMYTLGYQCTTGPTPAGLPYSGGATARIPYLILDRFNSADTMFPDDSSQMYRNGASGMPGVNPTLGLMSNSGQPISCFNIQNSTAEVTWATAAPAACTASVASTVSAGLCGLDLRFDPSPSSTYSTVCSNITNASTIESAYTQDTDSAEEDVYTSYSGNGRRLITISIIDPTTFNTANMTILGFRQFLVQPALNLTTLNAADTNGRFLALYVGNVAPVKQGNFGSCGVTSGPGKVVLHQ